MKTRNLLAKSIIVFALIACATFLIESATWFQNSWDDIDFAIVAYQLSTPLQGTNQEVIDDYCSFVFPKVILISGSVSAFFYFFASLFAKLRICIKITLFSKTHEIRLGKLFGIIGRRIICLLLIVSYGAGLFTKVKELGVDTYISDVMSSSSIFEENYASPDDVTLLFPKEKRNLIFIFLESMEVTYASVEAGGAKQENYIPELTELAERYVSISDSDKVGGYCHALRLDGL